MATKKVMLKVEFILRASPTIVYQFLTTPACLVRWFCDEVDIEENVFNFAWDGNVETATLIEDWEDELLRFEWEDGYPNEYLEFAISKSPITDETILTITDFAEPGDVEDVKKIWNNQINQMMKEAGAA
jgi:uncharacterized protein YndB with AHSA1/START domain